MATTTDRPRLLSQLIGTTRPLSWVNTAYPFGAAYLLAGGGVDLRFVLGTLFFLVPYNLLMYGVNDVFDYESDLRNPRKGGVEGVVLDRSFHRLVLWLSGVLTVPFVVALVLLGDTASTLVLAISIAAVVAYSAPVLRFKERPVLDSLTSSTHFVSPAVFGLVLTGAEVDRTALAALAGFFLWGVASHAFGAVQDVRADREAGLGSVATVLGAAGTTRIAFGCYLVAGALLLLLDGPARLSALLVVPYLVNVAPYLSVSDADCERAHAGWQRFLWLNYLTGFLLTQLLIWIVLDR
ncbi:prenyltransferase [Nocardioides sp. zg-536]|uniref:Prenyltransferase n=1 Tax=Nocardioides faecalis TaxID=2803858 RepID=A0A939BUI8_9ACTN|nr:prenyltransferase [Nocardioides faecalis]MBM9458921.1 prenyltransferase [Nocardioides faecalis]MBS4753983.1 prenyltransferase [Nocardioides faecalis]QVI60321.1 prenyltransferase [Nocardioides faecalis]